MTAEPPRPQDKVVILKRLPVFRSCTEEQLHLIADRTRLVEYKKGEHVYREGDSADAFYIVSSGRLRVFSQAGEREHTFTVLHNGDTFGEISLLTGETHSASVQALNDTLVLQIEKKDFDEVINRIPTLVLYLSRLLSKRLRTRDQSGHFAEATVLALYSAVSGVGRTCFAVTLAAQLARETEESVVVVDFSGEADDVTLLYGADGKPQLPPDVSFVEELSEERFDQAVTRHPLGFRVLSASALRSEAGVEQMIAPLLSYLTNRFHYVLIDLPVELDPPILKVLVQSDLVYLVTDTAREHVIQTTALVHQLQGAIGPLEQRLKLILNLFEATNEALHPSEVARQIGHPIAATLPFVPSTSGQLTREELGRLLEEGSAPYVRTVRRIARELGGMLVGLALGSGAALGLAHIGVLKVFERERIPVDLIAGTSIGAYIGGLWASGYSTSDLERMALRFKNPWATRRMFILDMGIPVLAIVVGFLAGEVIGVLAGFWTGFLFGFMVCVALGLVLGPLIGGPIQGTRLMQRLQEDFGAKTFEDTWVPIKVVAANPMAREEVVFESGSLIEAIRASVSIPGIFKPVTRMGQVCLDGGVINPVPISVLKRAGAHHVIAVNVFPSGVELAAHQTEVARRRTEREAQLASRRLPVRLWRHVRQEFFRSLSPIVFDVIMRSMQAMEHQIAEVSCRDADLTLRPTVPGANWLEFDRPEQFIRRGEEIALQYLPELKRITRAHGVDKTEGRPLG